MPEVPPDDELPDAAETFGNMEWGDLWSEAHMVSVCHYLRAGIHLKIPVDFWGVVPRKL